MKPKADILFEASWEVCNKVGGIFTVLSSKSKQIQKHYKNNYCLVGPYFEEASRTSFRESEIPKNYVGIYKELKEMGIVCHFGSWLIEGDPSVILLDFRGYWAHMDEIKKTLWDSFQVDSLDGPYDFSEPVLWSYAVGILMEKIKTLQKDKTMIFHAHEWLAGASILYIKKNNLNIPTTFTTHATVLGRTLAGNGQELYSILDKINPEEEARKFGIIAKYSLEKASANAADVFTTVSQVTAMEAKSFLKREVDVVLPNGLDMMEFPSFEELTQKHNLYRNRLREFALHYFFPYYSFDLRESLFFFTASRYEFHNKGIDIFIESLGRLNEKMKKEKHKKTIVTFFFVPAGVGDIRPEIVHSRETFRDIKESLKEEENDIQENILYALTSEKTLTEKAIFKEDFLRNMERKLLRLKTSVGKPAPLSTHYLPDENNDPIINAFKQAGLQNREEDKVKVIFYPIYLSGADGLGDLDYYQTIQSSHLGVFPSYYEPWGYTPLEAAALGVPAITSNLSGFGKYFYDVLNRDKVPGIRVLDMENNDREQVVKALTKSLNRFTNFDRKERIDNKIRARKIAFMADWENFASHYIEAENLSVERKNK
ncbi:MAG: glycosyltransferase [Candidatus Paceibacterota bacterium]